MITVNYANTNLNCSKKLAILILGDSLSSGYGMTLNKSWVHLLKKKLHKLKVKSQIYNNSIAGSTTHNGLSRLKIYLKTHQPNISIIALGGNDALRGFNLKVSKQNLEQMVTLLKNVKSDIILVGVRIFPNYGQEYIKAFSSLYQQIAKIKKVYYIPEILKNIAENPKLMQEDGIHPNAKAQNKILQRIMPTLLKLIRKQCKT